MAQRPYISITPWHSLQCSLFLVSCIAIVFASCQSVGKSAEMNANPPQTTDTKIDSGTHSKAIDAKPLTEQSSERQNSSTAKVPDWTISKELLTGQISFSSNPLFRELAPEFSTKSIYLLRPVAEQFEAMCRAALLEGIELQALSGARTYAHQKYIWEKKWRQVRQQNTRAKALTILGFSAMPMTSRHHWGTDVDINSLDNDYFTRGEGLRVYRWLQQYAPNFGFWQVYSDKSKGRKGYNMERWHWSYMPIAGVYLQAYGRLITYADIRGFSGSELAQDLGIISDYVYGIEPLP